MGFTLYGGTAIALRLGHRKSVDFDFFTGPDLDKNVILESSTVLGRGSVIQDAENTLTIIAERAGEPVKISFFGGRVPARIAGRVGQPDVTDDGVLQVASLDDLFATKVKVILDRAEAKDYVDILALLAAGEPLDRALGAAMTIYGSAYQPFESVKALTYFGDGDLGTLSKRDQSYLIEVAEKDHAIGTVPLLASHLGI